MRRGTIMRAALAATAALLLVAGCSAARPAAGPEEVARTVVAHAAPGAVGARSGGGGTGGEVRAAGPEAHGHTEDEGVGAGPTSQADGEGWM